MNWTLILTIAVLVPVLAQAVLQKPAKPALNQQLNDRISHGFAKGHKKRGLFSPVPTFSQGIDYPRVKHSILKPFVVNYPVKSVPLGVKIPFVAPSNNVKYPLPVGHQVPVPYPGFGLNIQKPTHLNPTAVKPAWPVNCPNPTNHPVHHILPATPVVPIVPTSTVHVHPAILPAPVIPAPALAHLLPLPHAPIPFATRPIIKPFIPIAQHVPVAPAFHPAPAIIRPGNSLHTSYFATFPRHPFVNAVHPAPVHIQPAPVHIQPTPVHFHPAPAPIHPSPAFPIFNHHAPLNLIHPHLNQIPILPQKIGINFAHPPLNIIRPHFQPNLIPFGHFPVANAAPTNIPLSSGPNLQILPTPGIQEQPNEQFHGLHNFGAGATNAWTPMRTTQSIPNVQYPTQSHFVQENEAPQYQHQQQDGNENQQNTDYNEGYQYQQNPGPQFDEINQQLQHQQQQQQQQQYQNEQYSGNIQHEPQIPQTLPNHPLSGRPINEAYQNHIPLTQHLPFRDSSENFAEYS